MLTTWIATTKSTQTKTGTSIAVNMPRHHASEGMLLRTGVMIYPSEVVLAKCMKRYNAYWTSVAELDAAEQTEEEADEEADEDGNGREVSVT